MAEVQREKLVNMFRETINAIPVELTNRINFLKAEEFEDVREKLEPLIEELETTRKSFYYRRSRYQKKADDEVEVTKYMKFIHDVVKMCHEQDIELERILADES